MSLPPLPDMRHLLGRECSKARKARWAILFDLGYTVRDLAVAYGTSDGNVQGFVYRNMADTHRDVNKADQKREAARARRRRALELRDVEGLTFRQLGKELGISLERARQVVAKARREAQAEAHFAEMKQRLLPPPVPPGKAAFRPDDVIHTPETEWQVIQVERSA